MPKAAQNKKTKFINDLIASITNEERTFEMWRWNTKDQYKLATCKTAACLAGHIEAVRPALAKKYAKVEGAWNHSMIATRIWVHETGEACRLDFYGHGIAGMMRPPSRKTAAAHIRGTSKIWPQLPHAWNVPMR